MRTFQRHRRTTIQTSTQIHISLSSSACSSPLIPSHRFRYPANRSRPFDLCCFFLLCITLLSYLSPPYSILALAASSSPPSSSRDSNPDELDDSLPHFTLDAYSSSPLFNSPLYEPAFDQSQNDPWESELQFVSTKTLEPVVELDHDSWRDSFHQFEALAVTGVFQPSLLPAPKVVSTLMSADLKSIKITFDQDTNTVGPACDSIFSTTSLSALFPSTSSSSSNSSALCPNTWSLSCSWVTASQVAIAWEGKDKPSSNDCRLPRTLAPTPTPRLSLKNYTIGALGGGSYLMTTGLRLNVSYGTLLTSATFQPSASISAPLTIGNCDDAAMQLGDGVAGNGGRPFTSIVWSLLAPNIDPSNGFDTATAQTLNQSLSLASDASLNSQARPSRLKVPSAAMPAGQMYTFGVTIRNWIGASSSAIAVVNKSSSAIPSVRIKGAAVYNISRDDEVIIEGIYAASPCGASNSTKKPLSAVWSVTSVDPDASSLFSPTQTTIDIPSGSLIPLVTYVFRLTVSDVTNPNQPISNYAEVTYHIKPVPPPNLITAQFDNAITGVTLTFDVNTNQAGMSDDDTTCTSFLDPNFALTLGDGSSCTWLDPATAFLTLGSDATIDTSTRVVLKWKSILSDDGFSSASSPPIPPVRPLAPVKALYPVPLLRGAQTISIEEDLLVSGATSTGQGGRDFTYWNWTLVADTKNPTAISTTKFTAINDYLKKQNQADIDIANSLLTPGVTYNIQLTLVNFLGFAAVVTRSVKMSLVAIPRVSVVQDPQSDAIVSTTVTSTVTLSLPPSWPAAQSAVILCGWKALPPYNDSIVPAKMKSFSFVYEPSTGANSAPKLMNRNVNSNPPTRLTIRKGANVDQLHALKVPVEQAKNSMQSHFVYAHSAHTLSAEFADRFGNVATLSSRYSEPSRYGAQELLQSSVNQSPFFREMHPMDTTATSGASVLTTTTYLSLPAYSLSPGMSYQFALFAVLTTQNALNAGLSLNILSATNTSGGGFYSNSFGYSYNSAIVTVNIGHSPLVALIAGGDRLVTLKQGVLVRIDGSTSYDPDAQAAAGGALFVPGASVSYKWTCNKVPSGLACFSEQIASTYLVDSSVISLPPKLFSDASSADPSGTAGGFLFAMTVSVLDGTSRTASTKATITVTTQDVPDVSLTSLWTNPKPNVADEIKFSAAITSALASASTVYSVKWLATQPSNFVLKSSMTSTGLNALNLGLNANVLTPGVKYTFQLQGADILNPDNIGRGSISFTTGSPPSGGRCSVSPAAGHSIDDSFAFNCKNWNTEDVNQPLNYAFLLYKKNAATGADESIYLSSFSSTPSLSVDVMPAGDASANYTQVVHVIIQDKWGCSTTASINVYVLPSAQLSTGSGGSGSDNSAASAALISKLSVKVLGPAAASGNMNAFAPAFLTATALLPASNYDPTQLATDSSSSGSSSGGTTVVVAFASADVINQRNTLLLQVASIPNTVNTQSTVSQRLQLSNVVCNDPLAMDDLSRDSCTSYVSSQVAIVRGTQAFTDGRSAMGTLGSTGNAAPVGAILFTPTLAKTVLTSIDAVMMSSNLLLRNLAIENSSPVSNSTDVTAVNSTSIADSRSAVQDVTDSVLAVVHQLSQGSVIGKSTSEAPTVVSTSFLFISSKVFAASDVGGSSLTSQTGNSTSGTSVNFPSTIFSSGGNGGLSMLASTFFVHKTNLYSYLDDDPTTDTTMSGTVSLSIFNPSTNSSSSSSSSSSNNSTDVNTVLPDPTHLSITGLRAPIRISIPHAPIVATTSSSSTNGTDGNSTASGNSTTTTTEYDIVPQCRFYDDSIGDWNTDGCIVDFAHSTATETIILTTHLTDFNLHSVKITKDSLVPSLNFASLSDVLAISFPNLIAHPIPILSVLMVTVAYVFMLPIVHNWDVAQMLLWLEGKQTVHKHADISHLHLCERFWILMKGTFLFRHMWLGVLFRRPGETFTGAQKLTCCISLLLGCMAVSAFFRADNGTKEVGQTQAQVFLSDVLIGVYSSLLLIPVKVLFIELFRRSGVSWAVFSRNYHLIKEKMQESAMEAEGDRIQSIVTNEDGEILEARTVQGEDVTGAISKAIVGRKNKEFIVKKLSRAMTVQDIHYELTKKSKKGKQLAPLNTDSRESSRNSAATTSGTPGFTSPTLPMPRSIAPTSSETKVNSFFPDSASPTVNSASIVPFKSNQIAPSAMLGDFTKAGPETEESKRGSQPTFINPASAVLLDMTNPYSPLVGATTSVSPVGGPNGRRGTRSRKVPMLPQDDVRNVAVNEEQDPHLVSVSRDGEGRAISQEDENQPQSPDDLPHATQAHDPANSEAQPNTPIGGIRQLPQGSHPSANKRMNKWSAGMKHELEQFEAEDQNHGHEEEEDEDNEEQNEQPEDNTVKSIGDVASAPSEHSEQHNSSPHTSPVKTKAKRVAAQSAEQSEASDPSASNSPTNPATRSNARTSPQNKKQNSKSHGKAKVNALFPDNAAPAKAPIKPTQIAPTAILGEVTKAGPETAESKRTSKPNFITPGAAVLLDMNNPYSALATTSPLSPVIGPGGRRATRSRKVPMLPVRLPQAGVPNAAVVSGEPNPHLVSATREGDSNASATVAQGQQRPQSPEELPHAAEVNDPQPTIAPNSDAQPVTPAAPKRQLPPTVEPSTDKQANKWSAGMNQELEQEEADERDHNSAEDEEEEGEEEGPIGSNPWVQTGLRNRSRGNTPLAQFRPLSASRNSRGEYKRRVIWQPSSHDEEEPADEYAHPDGEEPFEYLEEKKQSSTTKTHHKTYSHSSNNSNSSKKKRTIWSPKDDSGDEADTIDEEVANESKLSNASTIASLPSSKKRQLWSPEWKDPSEAVDADEKTRADQKSSAHPMPTPTGAVLTSPLPQGNSEAKSKRQLWSPDWKSPEQILADEVQAQAQRDSQPAVDGQVSHASDLPSVASKQSTAASNAQGIRQAHGKQMQEAEWMSPAGAVQHEELKHRESINLKVSKDRRNLWSPAWMENNPTLNPVETRSDLATVTETDPHVLYTAGNDAGEEGGDTTPVKPSIGSVGDWQVVGNGKRGKKNKRQLWSPQWKEAHEAVEDGQEVRSNEAEGDVQPPSYEEAQARAQLTGVLHTNEPEQPPPWSPRSLVDGSNVVVPKGKRTLKAALPANPKSPPPAKRTAVINAALGIEQLDADSHVDASASLGFKTPNSRTRVLFPGAPSSNAASKAAARMVDAQGEDTSTAQESNQTHFIQSRPQVVRTRSKPTANVSDLSENGSSPANTDAAVSFPELTSAPPKSGKKKRQLWSPEWKQPEDIVADEQLQQQLQLQQQFQQQQRAKKRGFGTPQTQKRRAAFEVVPLTNGGDDNLPSLDSVIPIAPSPLLTHKHLSHGKQLPSHLSSINGVADASVIDLPSTVSTRKVSFMSPAEAAAKEQQGSKSHRHKKMPSLIDNTGSLTKSPSGKTRRKKSTSLSGKSDSSDAADEIDDDGFSVFKKEKKMIKMVGLYGDYEVPEDEAEKGDLEKIDETEARIPYWCLHVTYILCLIWCAAASFVIVLYGLKFDRLDEELQGSSASGWSVSAKWLTNVLQAVAQDLFIIDPTLIALTTFGQLWLGPLFLKLCPCCIATGDKGLGA